MLSGERSPYICSVCWSSRDRLLVSHVCDPERNGWVFCDCPCDTTDKEIEHRNFGRNEQRGDMNTKFDRTPSSCPVCVQTSNTGINGANVFSPGPDPHIRCKKCGIRFGGSHSGGELPIPENQQGMCIACCYRHLPETFIKEREFYYDY